MKKRTIKMNGQNKRREGGTSRKEWPSGHLPYGTFALVVLRKKNTKISNLKKAKLRMKIFSHQNFFTQSHGIYKESDSLELATQLLNYVRDKGDAGQQIRKH